MALSTMGALANWRPPAEDEIFFKNIVRVLEDVNQLVNERKQCFSSARSCDTFSTDSHPSDDDKEDTWVPPPLVDEPTIEETLIADVDNQVQEEFEDFAPGTKETEEEWVVNTPTYEDLFGANIVSELECRLRFAIPTVKLAKAHSEAYSLSERRYKQIKRTLLRWPLGRALIYAPLHIMAKVHPVQAYNKFHDLIPTIKKELISRHEASKLLRLEAPDIEVVSATSSVPASKSSYSPDEHTTTKEPRMSSSGAASTKISKADESLVKQAISCQRFNSDGWQNIRYAEVQKQFQATPAFTALKTNSNLATVTPPWQLVTVLEKMDLCLGAITHGLLQQRKTFQNIYQSASPQVKSYISKNFLSADSSFRKISDSLLQYSCGKRAEVIQQRRGIYKPSNKTLNELLHAIPPSEHHLFSEPQLSDFIKEQGGSSKLFPGKFRKPADTNKTYANRFPARRAQPTNATEKERPRYNNHYTNSYKSSTNRRPEKTRFTTKRGPAKQNKNNKRY